MAPVKTPRTVRTSALRTPCPVVAVRKKKRPQQRFDTRIYTRVPASHEPSHKGKNKIFYCAQNLGNTLPCSFNTAVATNFRKYLEKMHGMEIDSTAPKASQAASLAMDSLRAAAVASGSSPSQELIRQA